MAKSEPVRRRSSHATLATTEWSRSATRWPYRVHGRITGYFVPPEEYEDFLRFKALRRSFATSELPHERVRAIAKTRMDPRHNHLNALLDRD